MKVSRAADLSANSHYKTLKVYFSINSKTFSIDPKMTNLVRDVPVGLPVDQQLPQGVVLGALGQLHEDVGNGGLVLVGKQPLLLFEEGRVDLGQLAYHVADGLGVDLARVLLEQLVDDLVEALRLPAPPAVVLGEDLKVDPPRLQKDLVVLEEEGEHGVVVLVAVLYGGLLD